MTPKNRTLEGKNRMLGGEGGSKIVENRRTSFMHAPLSELKKNIHSECFSFLQKTMKGILR